MSLNPLPLIVNNYLTTDFAVSTKTSADFTVIAPFAIDQEFDMFFHQDMIHERLESLQMVEALFDMAVKYDVQAIAIEKGVISHAILPSFRLMMQERNQYFVIWEKTPVKDKRARGGPYKSRSQQGKIYFPDTPFFHSVVVSEVLAFPAGKNDDIFDAIALGCTMIDELNPPPPEEETKEDDVVPGSYEDMMNRVHSQKSSRTHVPDYIDGRPRKTRRDRYALQTEKSTDRGITFDET